LISLIICCWVAVLFSPEIGERAQRHRKLDRCAVVGAWHVPLRSRGVYGL